MKLARVLLPSLPVIIFGLLYYFTSNLVISLGMCGICLIGELIILALQQKYIPSELVLREAEIKNIADRDYKQFMRLVGSLLSTDADVIHADLVIIKSCAQQLLEDTSIDTKIIHQIRLYLPKINQILEVYIASGDRQFKSQAQDFLASSAVAFNKMVSSTKKSDIRDALNAMKTLESTYAIHGYGEDKEDFNNDKQ